ncbi:valacyclovir hydrolase-like [Scyliorhinus canicula]|uniref:valacyclovir hydrolase-like n=1 Tax=Scyliorhinus canicula TaxID=7830 RepID=UPI0018F373F8|nr:valacyclovir hydrolase-like [Scyliorhinus canicula]
MLVAARRSLSLCSPGVAHCRTITSAKIEVNGVHLHYQQTGKGDHPLLLLPGALGSSQTDFGPQLKSLNKERFTVVSWDPRGYGRSIPPQREYPLDFYHTDAQDAVDLMKALHFKRFSLLGWSGGGIAALIAASKYPSLVRKLVVWGANAYVSQEDIINLDKSVADVSKWSEKMRKIMVEMYGAEYFIKTWAAWIDVIHAFGREPDGNICRDILPHVKCPTLIVHGEKDAVLLRCHADYLHKHIKGSRLHLMPEGKHNLHLQFAEEFNSLVEEFLMSQD